MEKNLQGIILAAGKSTRFNTGRSKLLEVICGREMILYPINLLNELGIPPILVVGYQKDQIIDLLDSKKINCDFVIQEEQLGTGHALLCTKAKWSKDNILIMNGDMPLISSKLIEDLYSKHINTKAKLSFVVAQNMDPFLAHSYGKVIKDNDGIKIVEVKDLKGDPSDYSCINAGIYIVKRSFLEESINKINASEVTQEFYLTDLVGLASDKNYTVSTIPAPFDMVRGVNDLKELWAAEQIKRSELISKFMEKGVRFTFAQNVHLDIDVEIGRGTIVYGGVGIMKGTRIGKNCVIGSFTIMQGSSIGDNSRIRPHSFIKNSTIGSNCVVGPFAYIGEESKVADNTIVDKFDKLENENLEIGPFIAATKANVYNNLDEI
jgi:bifunctional UDP-N-acetylglucosamine pyrophosphorylase/glucosamine-1-phosphate N-acetyltransferase